MSKPMLDARDQGLLERPMAETDEEQLLGLFLDKAKPDAEWQVGTELEVFGFHRDDGRSASLEDLQGVLSRLGERLGWQPDREASGDLVGLKGEGASVSLEPGGQLEFATRPHRALRELRDELTTYCRALSEAGGERSLGFWCVGHQPFVDLSNVPRMPKARYERMRSYLSHQGPRALEMMHLTSSIQCTVDFRDEDNLVAKTRTAVRASPFLSALVAASPFKRGAPNGFKSIRYQIWLETDAQRCGIWPEMTDDEGLRLHRYIRRAMDVVPMFFIRDGRYLPAEAKPFAAFVHEGFEGTTLTVSDFVDHLTTFFPEVRPKGYLEMRGADCLPPVYATAVTGFWRGLLDDDATRAAADDRLRAMDYETITRLQPQVAVHGLSADSAAGPVLEVVRWLVTTAYERLRDGAPDCAECLEPLVELARDGQSPADRMLRAFEAEGIDSALAPFEV